MIAIKYLLGCLLTYLFTYLLTDLLLSCHSETHAFTLLNVSSSVVQSVLFLPAGSPYKTIVIKV